MLNTRVAPAIRPKPPSATICYAHVARATICYARVASAIRLKPPSATICYAKLVPAISYKKCKTKACTNNSTARPRPPAIHTTHTYTLLLQPPYSRRPGASKSPPEVARNIDATMLSQCAVWKARYQYRDNTFLKSANPQPPHHLPITP